MDSKHSGWKGTSFTVQRMAGWHSEIRVSPFFFFFYKNGLFKSLAPGRFEWNFRYVIFKQILVIDGWGICCEIVIIWMLLDFTDDQSTLVQVMAWCRHATSHYLSQCSPRSLLPYGVTRPQWVNLQNKIICPFPKFNSGTVEVWERMLWVIDLFHNNFPPASSIPNTVNQLMSYNNQLPAV